MIEEPNCFHISWAFFQFKNNLQQNALLVNYFMIYLFLLTLIISILGG